MGVHNDQVAWVQESATVGGGGGEGRSTKRVCKSELVKMERVGRVEC